MTILNKRQILDAPDLKTEDVEVPEWGGTVRVRALTGTQRDAYQFSIVHIEGNEATSDMTNVSAKLVAASLIDEQGNLLFNESEVAALGRKSARALQRVFEAASRLSGLTKEDVKELVKNLGSGQSAASITS